MLRSRKREEPEATIPLIGALVQGVHDDGMGTDDLREVIRGMQCMHQQLGAKAVTLHANSDSQASEEDNGDSWDADTGRL